MVEYLDSPIIKDTKNILYQNFVEKYCKLMQDNMRRLAPPTSCDIITLNIITQSPKGLQKKGGTSHE